MARLQKNRKQPGPASSSSTTSTTDRKPSFGRARDASQRRQQGGFRPVTPEAVHGFVTGYSDSASLLSHARIAYGEEKCWAVVVVVSCGGTSEDARWRAR
ncbi:hypothetical protein NL676_003234 [Syzygium grande]|nr:hypothetical protein NL676_003234 [Syzygium grande]